MKILKISMIACLTLLMWSCEKFLTESSMDEVRPSTVRDMEQLARGELYFGSGYWDEYFNITKYMTDEMQCNGIDDESKYPFKITNSTKYRYFFSWDKYMYTKDAISSTDDVVPYLWQRPYQRIRGCNVILEYLDKVTGDDYLRESIRGEAYAMRGFYHFNIVNLVAEPYNAGDPNINLGIPLKLRSGVTDELFTRNTLAEVYNQIESDWLNAAKLLKKYPLKNADLFRMSRPALMTLLSRFYLYKEDWDKTILYADSVMMLKPELLDLSTLIFSLSDDIGVNQKTAGVLNEKTPVEILWAARTKDTSSENGVPLFTISDELMNLFESDYTNATNRGDLRAVYFIKYTINAVGTQKITYPLYIMKDLGNYDAGNPNSERNRNVGIRNAEALLNRAEAYIRKFMATGDNSFRAKALDDINFLRRNRFDTRNVPYVDINITDPQALFDFYKLERRRELCGEGHHRWCDLRRYGKPELKHEFRRLITDPPETFILPQGSPRYVLPIPEVVLLNNSKLEQNP